MPNTWLPKIVELQSTVGGFPLRWTTTTGLLPKPWAVGVAEMSTVQADAIDAEPSMHVYPAAAATSRFNSLPNAVRTRINAFFDDAGVARPAPTETVRELLTRLIKAVEPAKDLDSVASELDRETT